jgi:hypothetical protein
MTRHFHLMVQVFGEALGAVMFRKVGPWYSKRFGPASFFNKRVVHVATTEDFLSLLSQYQKWRLQFLDEDGNLKAKFQPKPYSQNLIDDECDDDNQLPLPAVVHRTAIPVPSGPNERW